MIEARLVEVNANPKQSYGINWAGVVGSSSSAQTFRYGGTVPSSDGTTQTVTFNNGIPQLADFVQGAGNRPAVTGNNNGNLNPLSALASGLRTPSPVNSRFSPSRKCL
jgi:type II secretory pathway component GspD/PulD (secretin)